MAKRLKPAEPRYEYIRAIVFEGKLRWEYKLDGRSPGRMSHDEDVSEWTGDDIVKLTKDVLCTKDDPVQVEVVYD